MRYDSAMHPGRAPWGFASLTLLAALAVACAASDKDTGGPNPYPGTGGSAGTGGGEPDGGGTGGGGTGGSDGGTGGSTGGTGGSGGTSTGGTGGTGGACPPPDEPFACPVTFTYDPGGAVSSLVVAGEWNGFSLSTATAMTPVGGGKYQATVDLQPGLQAYKYVVNGTDWRLDPGQGRRKYVGGVENSGIKVHDCRLPHFTVESSAVARPSAGQGTYQATLRFHDGIEGSGPDTSGYVFELEHNGTSMTVPAGAISANASTGDVTVSLSGLADGKYRLVVRGRTANCRASAPLRLVFWVEAEAFSWNDAIIYMVMTDRYRDGDPSNNPSGPTPGADPRGDWMGGDLEGLRQSIASGLLDQLGVRAIWLTPFQTNPQQAYLASDGVHKVTGYHGYWPIKAREVEPRIGGESALRAVVAEAHAHGIRILQDFVLNHVHEQHEYVQAHPDWFRTGCVCGTANCDWTSHALDCMFASYMPDIDHTVPEANAQFTADAIWWLDEFDLDGLRVDAVKHVEEIATRNLAAEVRETFEPAGTRYFLMGETAMGWNDCADPCNDENYGTISKYIGPFGLDGQFDFVLYHAVSYRTFAWSQKGFLHADYWFKHGLTKYPSQAIMTPYIGSHDTARFATLADPVGNMTAGNQWENTSGAPTTSEPYERTRIGFAWLLTLPGAPLLYYGDEYGQWGGVDPNNRRMWRDEAALSADEKATLSFVRLVGQARRDLVPLRRGEYISLSVQEDTMVYARKVASGNAAIVAMTRLGTPQSVSVDVLSSLGFTPGTVLHDHLGGPDATVSGAGTVTVTVPARSAVILAP
jgi:glycosidase